MFMDSSALSTPRDDAGNRSGRFQQQQHQQQHAYSSGSLRSESSEVYLGDLSCQSLRKALWERERERARASSHHDL